MSMLFTWSEGGPLKDSPRCHSPEEFFTHCGSDARSRATIGINLLEEGSVNHDQAVDGYSNRLPSPYEEGGAMAVAMVGASQEQELSTAFDKVSPDPPYVSMILQRKSFKSVDWLCPKEFMPISMDKSSSVGAIMRELCRVICCAR